MPYVPSACIGVHPRFETLLPSPRAGTLRGAARRPMRYGRSTHAASRFRSTRSALPICASTVFTEMPSVAAISA